MDPIHPLLPKFERSLDLTDAERQAIGVLPVRIEEVGADQAILREGARPTRCGLIVEGLACSGKVIRNGGRQIINFHVPDDLPDLTSLHLDVRDCDIWALSDCTLAFVDHRDLHRLCEEHPRLARFLWRTTLVDAAIFREWTVNVGMREGLNRMAHLLCEMMVRMEAIGRAQGGSCDLPLTQADLGEATGLSSVHVNRLLQDLRGRKLISFGRGKLTIHDRSGLADLADFRTDYLHLLRGKAA